jgi:hypothetical protein
MSSSSGLEIAASAASRARSSPEALPDPIIAMPVSDITVRTSAKSTLIKPGRVISSAMPCTAPCSTVFAALNASSSVVVAAEHRQQLLVRNRDQGVDVFRELEHALIGDARALVAFHLERLGDDGDRQDAEFLGDLRDHGSGARAGAAAHARGDEQHVAAFDELDDAVAILHRGLAADFRVGAGAQALGDVAADLQRGAHLGVLERLRIGVDANEIHALEAGLDHVRDGIAAAAAHAQHLDDGTLTVRVHEFEHSNTPSRCYQKLP